MTSKTGPKESADNTALNLPNRRTRSKSFADFSRRYFVVKGKKGPTPLKPRPWQVGIVASFFDSDSVRLAGLQIGRGNGKSTLLAAIALWNLFTVYGADVVCCAVDERQAGIIYKIARFAVENSPELAARAQIYKDEIRVPGSAATLRVLPAEAKRLEGLDFSLAILDEAGFANNDTFATLLDSQGKREQSTLVLIGTPGPNADSPLGNLREQARDIPDDLTAWVEFSADDTRSHPWDCECCLRAANPAYADFLHASGVDASRPPKVSEARWRRVRLGQWVSGDGDGWMDRDEWDTVADPNRVILPGAPVVVAFDGSRKEDSTAVCMVSIEQKPIVQLARLVEPHLQDADYRVPVLEVEALIDELTDIYDVREITGDPAGWHRTFEVLDSKNYPTAEFPNSPTRMVPAIAAFKQAVLEGELTHDGNPKLAAHVTNAVMDEKPALRGYVIKKVATGSPKKIDAAITAVMAHSRARWHFAQKEKPRSFRKIDLRR